MDFKHVFQTKGRVMLLGTYQFFCEFKTNAVLPPFKGSTFRGVFGRALKQVVCALKHQECLECLLRSKCVYAQVFELQEPLNKNKTRIAARPHPFVIEPPLSTETLYPAGAPFDFTLILLGETNQYLPYFIYAFEKMGEVGIGKKENGQRGRFALKKVFSSRDLIYESASGKLKAHPAQDRIQLRPADIKQDQLIRIRVILETPLRLKFENKLTAELPFHVLARAMLRRISSLMNAYGDGEPALDYRGLVEQAHGIRVAENRLTWFDWRRYSFRQDQAMLMGGMVGSVVYEGRLSAYLPLVEFCEKVHLGKQTTFGLGKIRTEIIT
jgi:CRISPR/Cas system endoribonuclease Cas6 (RAMP superfamily)